MEPKHLSKSVVQNDQFWDLFLLLSYSKTITPHNTSAYRWQYWCLFKSSTKDGMSQRT